MHKGHWHNKQPRSSNNCGARVNPKVRGGQTWSSFANSRSNARTWARSSSSSRSFASRSMSVARLRCKDGDCPVHYERDDKNPVHDVRDRLDRMHVFGPKVRLNGTRRFEQPRCQWLNRLDLNAATTFQGCD